MAWGVIKKHGYHRDATLERRSDLDAHIILPPPDGGDPARPLPLTNAARSTQAACRIAISRSRVVSRTPHASTKHAQPPQTGHSIFERMSRRRSKPAASISMPVESSRPVLGHRTMTTPSCFMGKLPLSDPSRSRPLGIFSPTHVENILRGGVQRAGSPSAFWTIIIRPGVSYRTPPHELRPGRLGRGFFYMLGARCPRRGPTETVPPSLCSRFGKFLSFSRSSSYLRLRFDWQVAIRFLTTFKIFFHRCWA
jgi:hypothetical protein